MTVTSGTGYPPTVHEKTPAVELSSSVGAVTDTDSFSGRFIVMLLNYCKYWLVIFTKSP